MKRRNHRWNTLWSADAETWRFSVCRACGQQWSALRPTAVCPCWKMRLPKRKEK